MTAKCAVAAKYVSMTLSLCGWQCLYAESFHNQRHCAGASYTFYLPFNVECDCRKAAKDAYYFRIDTTNRTATFIFYVNPVSVAATSPESMIDEFEALYVSQAKQMGTIITFRKIS